MSVVPNVIVFVCSLPFVRELVAFLRNDRCHPSPWHVARGNMGHM